MTESARQTQAIAALGEEMIALARVLDERLRAVEGELQAVSGRMNGEPIDALSERLREVEARLAALAAEAAPPAVVGSAAEPPSLDLFESTPPALETGAVEETRAPDLSLVDTQAEFIPTPIVQPAAGQPRRAQARRRAGERRTALIGIGAALALALAGAGFYLMHERPALAAAEAGMSG